MTTSPFRPIIESGCLVAFDQNTGNATGIAAPNGVTTPISGGGGVLGPVSNISTLNSTYPATSNALKSAYVSGVGFLDSDGLTWGIRGVAGAVSANTSITVIGDSIAAYGSIVGAGGSAPDGFTSQSIIAHAFAALPGLQPYVVANRGVGGVTIDTVISSQLPSAMTDQSDILWVHAGINNLNPSIDATLPTVAQIVSKMQRLLDRASAKPLVVLDALTPLDSASISGALPRASDIPLVNAGYKALAAQYKNVIYNDVYTPLAASATTGLAIPNVTLSTDGIHLTTYGAYLAGVASGSNLALHATLRNRMRVTTYNSMPSFSGTTGTKTPSTGTINGNVPDNLNVQIASNATGVVVTSTVGAAGDNSQRLRIQNGNALRSVIRLQLAVFTNYLTGATSGAVFQATGKYSVVSQTGLERVDLQLQQDPSGSVVNFSSMATSTKENGSGGAPFPVFPPAPYSEELTCVNTLTATPTSLNVTYSISVAPGGDVTLDFSGLTFYIVTPQ